MTTLKFKKQEHLTRDEAATRLTQIAEALKRNGEFELERGREQLELELDVPEEVLFEFEFEIEDGQAELEVEVKWAPPPPPPPPPLRPPRQRRYSEAMNMREGHLLAEPTQMGRSTVFCEEGSMRYRGR